jgi:hypothetical protein
MDRNTEVFKQLLDPKFDWSNFDLETLEGLGQEIANNKKISQRVLGKLAIQLGQLPTRTSLKDFSKDIGVSYATLRVYKHIEEVFAGEYIPQDISFTSLLIISRQDDPKKTLREVLDHGLSNPEIIKSLGSYKHKKLLVCPKCNEEFSV